MQSILCSLTKQSRFQWVSYHYIMYFSGTTEAPGELSDYRKSDQSNQCLFLYRQFLQKETTFVFSYVLI